MLHRKHYLLIALAFTAVAAYGSFVPLKYHGIGFERGIERFQHIRYLPLPIANRADWVANLILYVPIGFWWLAVVVGNSPSRGFRLLLAPLVVEFIAILCVAIEFLQQWFPPRTVSLNDIVAEIIGSLVGVILWIGMGPSFVQWLTLPWRLRSRIDRIQWLLQAYCVGLFFYSILPLDVIVNWSELIQKYREGKVLFMPFSHLSLASLSVLREIAHAAAYVPIGWYLTMPRRSGGSRSVFQIAAIAALYIAGIETAQLLIYSRYANATDVVVAACGICVGVLSLRSALNVKGRLQSVLAAAKGKMPGTAWFGLAGVYGCLMLVALCAPYEIVTDWESISTRFSGIIQVPFSSLYRGTEFRAATEIARKGCLYGLMGALLGMGLATTRLLQGFRGIRIAMATMIAALFATCVELAQVFIPPRVPDVTDILIGTVAALAGLYVVMRLVAPVSLDQPDSATSPSDETQATASESSSLFPSLHHSSRRQTVLRRSIFSVIMVFLIAPWLALGISVASRSKVHFEHDASSLNLCFTSLPDDPHEFVDCEEITIPEIRGANAIWGGTGRDHRGHIWFGVCAQDVLAPSAHLFEYMPDSGKLVDRGDVLSQLESVGLCRRGEGQAKIHSKIIQGSDGQLYFTSMDEEGEKEDGTRLPIWGSHLWRLRLSDHRWEHLFSAPEGLIAVAGGGDYIYALGLFDHIVYQFDCKTDTFRSITIGSVGGHISRNFFCDNRGHAYVPRLKYLEDDGQTLRVSLVELDVNLREVGETVLKHYINTAPQESHGIVAFQPMEDGSIVFATHMGFLYQVIPQDRGPAEIRELGWFHPEGRAYVPSMFTFAGKRYLVGAGQRIFDRSRTYQWLVFDMDTRSSRAFPIKETESIGSLLLYGCVTRDNQGRFYLAGRKRTADGGRGPVLLKAGLLAQ